MIQRTQLQLRQYFMGASDAIIVATRPKNEEQTQQVDEEQRAAQE